MKPTHSWYELVCHWWGFDSSSDTWMSYEDVERDYSDLLDQHGMVFRQCNGHMQVLC